MDVMGSFENIKTVGVLDETEGGISHFSMYNVSRN